MSSELAVKQALFRRVANARLDLITAYGIERVTDAIIAKGESFADTDLEEIGSSDVSCWIMDIEDDLKRQKERDNITDKVY